MKAPPILAVAAGVTLIATFIGYFGAGAMVRALLAIGWRAALRQSA